MYGREAADVNAGQGDARVVNACQLEDEDLATVNATVSPNNKQKGENKSERTVKQKTDKSSGDLEKVRTNVINVICYFPFYD